MTYPRKSLVSIKETPYYHCVARCVRRAWLWGVDEYAGKDYSHRKQWVVDRLRELSAIYAIEICAFAVMAGQCSRLDRQFLHPCKSPITITPSFSSTPSVLVNGVSTR